MKAKSKENNKAVRKVKKAIQPATQPQWHQMNRKQRRELTRTIQSEEISLEVVHPDAAGIDIGNEVHYVSVPPSRDNQSVTPLCLHDGRTEGHGGLVEAMRDPDCGDAIHGRLLDRGF